MAARRKATILAPPVERGAQRFFSSGCAPLDCVLGGGWAHGKVINVVGDKSTGKTLLAIEACANYAREVPEGRIKYYERENAFDEEYAGTLGLPRDRVDVIRDLGTVEELFRAWDANAKDTKTPVLNIVDSLDSYSDQAELDREIGDASYGAAKGKMLSEGFRRFNNSIGNTGHTVFVISQVRDNLTAMAFSKKVKRSGGHALDFYASQVLWLYEIGKIPRTIGGLKRFVGAEIRMVAEKNKVGYPWREVVVPIMYGYGMDDVAAMMDWVCTAAPERISEVGVAGINKDNWKRHKDKLDRTFLSAWFAKVWEDVDVQFRPEKRKYE